MTTPPTAINSLQDATHHFVHNNRHSRLAFRGEPANYGSTALVSSFGRLIQAEISEDFKTIEGLERINQASPHLAKISTLIAECEKTQKEYHRGLFRKLIESKQRPLDTSIIMAQHSGFETTLLDWTQNPFVALYFSCQNTNEDGFIFSSSMQPNFSIDEGDYSHKTERSSFFILPDRDNPRIARQSGLFSISPIPWLPFDFDYSAMNNIVGQENFTSTTVDVTKFVVPNEAKLQILTELEIVGVNPISLGLIDVEKIKESHRELTKDSIKSLIRSSDDQLFIRTLPSAPKS